jgi:O-antigen ligase
MSGIQMLVEVNVKQLKHYFLPASYTILILGFFLFPSSKSISNFFYLAVVAPFVILIIMKKVDLRSLLFSRTFLLVSIYLVYMVCTLFWADSLGLSDLSKYGRRVLYILIFLGVTIHLTQSYPTLLKGLIIVLCGTAAIVAIANVLFFYRQHPFPSTRLFGYGLLHMPFKASSIYGIIVLACMYIILTQHSTSVRLAYLGLLLVSFSYMLLAQSRSSLLALVSAMIVWQLSVWMFHKEGKSNRRNKVLTALVVIAAASAVLFMAYPGFFEEAFLRGYSPRRLELWGKLLARVEEAPWFGHGLTASPRTEISYGRILFHPHSVYVGTLLYGGIVGLLLLVAAVISALWQGFGCGRQPINLAAATMVLYGTLCIGLNGNMLIHHVKPFWLFFWFPVALVIASEIPGHPLYGKSRMPSERDGKSAAARLE